MKKALRLFSIVTLSLMLSLATFKGIESVRAFTAPPCLESEVMVDTGNGFGSTSTSFRRFTNVDVNVGSDITYADSATDGASFTINSNGLYSISYTDYRGDAGDTIAITRNSASITGSVSPQGDIFCLESVTPTATSNCSVTVILSATDVVRATFSNAGFSDSQTATRFVITKIR